LHDCRRAGYIAGMSSGFARFAIAIFCAAALSFQMGCGRGTPQKLQYPGRWWEPVSKEGAPDWEIFPQEAGPGEVILSKRQPDLGLLSNFAATPLEFRGQHFASLEGLWQSMLYPEGPDDPRATFPGLVWKYTRDQVAQMTAFEAKAAGDLGSENMKKMGIDWVTFQGQRMEYKPAEAGRALPADRRGHSRESTAKSRRQGGPAGDRRPRFETRPPSRAQCPGSLALFRYPDGNTGTIAARSCRWA
jgi:hypothetical protein